VTCDSYRHRDETQRPIDGGVGGHHICDVDHVITLGGRFRLVNYPH
jgi:hypothetical protein